MHACFFQVVPHNTTFLVFQKRKSFAGFLLGENTTQYNACMCFLMMVDVTATATL
jgi:hypothetical protein